MSRYSFALITLVVFFFSLGFGGCGDRFNVFGTPDAALVIDQGVNPLDSIASDPDQFSPPLDQRLPDVFVADLEQTVDAELPPDQGCPPQPACNWCGGSETLDSQGCVSGYTCANGVDPCATEPCSNTHPSNSCLAGEKCGADMLCWPCTADKTGCGAICTDTDTDSVNCGACGNVCGVFQECMVGKCMTQYWKEDISPTSADLFDVWGFSESDIWAVGASGSIVHYDGATWSMDSSPTQQTLYDVWGYAATDVWAVGSGGTLLRRQGSTWVSVGLPTLLTVYSIHGTSATDIWAAADTEMFHFDGSTWTTVPLPTAAKVTAVWARTATDAWAGGAYGYSFHYDGSSWKKVALPTSPIFSMGVGDFWGATSTDVWATGYDGNYDRHMLHYDGQSWTQWNTAPTKSGSSLWGSSSSEIWAVGKGVFRYAGTTWEEYPSPTNKSLLGVWGTSFTDLWAVGAGGTIISHR
jgi:hypothetical protein